MVVMSTRNAQRSMIPVVTELPPTKPERLVSMIFKTKYISAEEINKRLRILPSKDGEMAPFGTDRLFVTDWATNVNRIAKFIAELDQPGAEKLVSQAPKKNAGEQHFNSAEPRRNETKTSSPQEKPTEE